MNKLTASQRRYLAAEAARLVEKFNKKFPVGSTAYVREVEYDEDNCLNLFLPMRVRSRAYLKAGMYPVCLFEGIPGCLSINEKHVHYYKKKEE